jgi:hypothetical protein
MKIRIFILILCLFSIAYSLTTGSVIYFEYQKERNENKLETALVYYEHSKASYMFITDPVIQNIKMIPDRLLYFYPEKNTALIMNNPDAVIATSPVQLFINTGSEDQGLSSLGFSLTSHELRQDTLVKTWEIKGKKKKEYIRIDVFSKELHIMKTRSYDADNLLIKEVNFSNWIKVKNYLYPLEIEIRENDLIDHYRFWNIKQMENLPDSIINEFHLPENCEVYEYTF